MWLKRLEAAAETNQSVSRVSLIKTALPPLHCPQALKTRADLKSVYCQISALKRRDVIIFTVNYKIIISFLEGVKFSVVGKLNSTISHMRHFVDLKTRQKNMLCCVW